MPPTGDDHQIAYSKPNYVDVLTLLVLAATLIAVLWYACEAHRQSGLTIFSVEEQLRPWVLLKTISPGLGPNAKWLDFENIGKGPAYSVAVLARFELHEHGWNPRPGFEHQLGNEGTKNNRTVLGPNSITTEAVFLSPPVDERLVRYIYGFVSYTDRFNQPRGLVFCQFLEVTPMAPLWLDCAAEYTNIPY